MFVYKCYVCFVDGEGKTSDDGIRRRSLGEQAQTLKNSKDRLIARRRITAAMQVALARTVVLKALSFLRIHCHVTFSQNMRGTAE